MRDPRDMVEYIECDCNDASHLIRVWMFDDGEVPELYLNIQMSHYKRFFGRLKIAVKYLLKLGEDVHWADSVIHPEDAERIMRVLEEYKKRYEDGGIRWL